MRPRRLLRKASSTDTVFAKDDAEVREVKECTWGPELSELDFHIRGCVKRKLTRLLPTTCTHHLAIVITFMHSLNKYIEEAHKCQALSWVQGYRSK